VIAPSNALTNFVAWKLKTSASPKVPIGKPLKRPAKACAASKRESMAAAARRRPSTAGDADGTRVDRHEPRYGE
jgi:hypothetical protein